MRWEQNRFFDVKIEEMVIAHHGIDSKENQKEEMKTVCHTSCLSCKTSRNEEDEEEEEMEKRGTFDVPK